MDEEVFSDTEVDSSDIAEIINQQAEMEREWQAKQPVTPMRYNCSVTKYVVAPISNYSQKTISLQENPAEDQQLLFAALYTAYYRIFYSDEFTDSVKESFSSSVEFFVDYLNDYEFTRDNRSSVLKDYETYRVRVYQVKPQSTGLAFVIRCIKVALDYKEFRHQLNDIEYTYLYTLTKTRAAPSDPKVQITLTEWFASHTWLRRADVGICHEHYSLLKSPKILVTSFRVTVVTTLHEIQLAKDALIAFFKNTDWKIEDIPALKTRDEFESLNSYYVYQKKYRLVLLNHFRKKYHEYPVQGEHLLVAIQLITAEASVFNACDIVLELLLSNKRVYQIHKCRKTGRKISTMKVIDKGTSFSFSFLRKVLKYAILSTGQSEALPTCDAEEILFSWLMSYQTVQPSDIPKLSSTDFQFVRNRKDQISHIDLQYFKGRSRAVHGLKMLERKTELGTVVLRFLQDKGKFNKNNNPIRCIDGFKGFSKNANGGSLFFIMQRYLRNKIEHELVKHQASSVFLDSMTALIENGVRYNSRTHKSTKWYAKHIDTPASKNIFPLSAIKNSSIHSRSDHFTPTQLLNYHSHTNEVERASYLSPQNEEWLNNCGLITRAVMQDLTVNLFRASEKEQRIFNTEFTQSAEIIDVQRDDILSRMKLITRKKNGRVDELGFTKYIESSDLPDTIYLVDCAETVMKYRHYLAEAAEKYLLLLANSPEYLLFRILPTVEWIELLFEQKRFSKQSITQGEAMYEKFCKELPPLFMSKIGG